jgi:hypothetical protein
MEELVSLNSDLGFRNDNSIDVMSDCSEFGFE